MKNSNREVYRPKQKQHNWLLGILIVLIVLLGGFLLLFSSWQKYIVYEKGEVHLNTPWTPWNPDTGTDGESADRPKVNAELVLDGYDFSHVETDAGNGVTAMKAVYVPATGISESAFAAYTDKMSSIGANALVLQVKPESGQLVYESKTEMATGYGLNGSFDLKKQVQTLKEQDIYLVAELCCCIDARLAERNQTVALRNADGSMCQNEYGTCLDPYNTGLRQYLSGLALELADMGFDEILLSYVTHPAGEGIVYTESMTTPPDAVSAVSSFSYYMEQRVGSAVKLSLRCAPDALHNGTADNGQDMSFLYRVFDRVYCASDANAYSSDLNYAESYMTDANAARFVPVGYTPMGDSSWLYVS